MTTPSPREVTQMLLDWSAGRQEAPEALVSAVYDELRQLAECYMRHERPDHTLQATALVHEAYLELIGQRQVRWQSRAHFFGLAAQLMRRILLEHARRRRAAKRGGLERRVPLEEAIVMVEAPDIDLLALDEALNRLTALDPPQGRIVELRFFGGLTIEETAEFLGLSPATIKREWTAAQAWLHRELKDEG